MYTNSSETNKQPLLEPWSESPCTVLSTTSYGPCWIILDPILEPLLVCQLVGLYQTSFGQSTYIQGMLQIKY